MKIVFGNNLKLLRFHPVEKYRWFAWYPVFINSGINGSAHLVWLCNVYRHSMTDYHGARFWWRYEKWT